MLVERIQIIMFHHMIRWKHTIPQNIVQVDLTNSPCLKSISMITSYRNRLCSLGDSTSCWQMYPHLAFHSKTTSYISQGRDGASFLTLYVFPQSINISIDYISPCRCSLNFPYHLLLLEGENNTAIKEEIYRQFIYVT